MRIEISDSYLAMKIQKEADFQHISVEELITRISKDYFDELDTIKLINRPQIKTSKSPFNPNV